MARQLLVSIGMVLLLVRAVPAEGKYPDPDSPAVETAARAALANAKVLGVSGKSVSTLLVADGHVVEG